MSVGLWNRQPQRYLAPDLRYDFDVFFAVEDVVDQFVEDDFLQKKKSLLIPAIVKSVIITIFFGTAPT